MGAMLNKDQRIRSAKAVEEFFDAYLFGSNEVVDIVLSCSTGVSVFYDVPCDIEYEEYPNDEESYSLNIHWGEATQIKGTVSRNLFPNYPRKSEYKTYFDYMSQSGEDLYFHNVWKDQMIIFIIKQTENTHNIKNIEQAIKDLSRE